MTKIAKTAADLMNTAVRTAVDDEDIEDVQLKMQMADVHHLPILNHEQRLVGIVSQRDITIALKKANAGRAPIRSIMTHEVKCVLPTTPADEVVATMIDHQIGCVPVVDDNWFILGIISETDFLKIALCHLRQAAADSTASAAASDSAASAASAASTG